MKSKNNKKSTTQRKPFSKLTKDIIRALQREFKVRSDTQGFLAVVQDWVIIIIAGILIQLCLTYAPSWASIFVLPFCWLVQGSRYRGFDNLVHEASHYNLFATKAFNNNVWIHFLYAFWVLKSVPDYRKSHLQHHAHTGDPVLDPDMRQNQAWGLSNINEATRPAKIWRIWIRPYTGYFTWYFLTGTVSDFIRSSTYRLPKILFGLMVVVAAITGLLDLLILNWLVPSLIVTPVLRFYAEAPEHINIFNFESAWGNSRSNIGWIHRWLLHPHNDGYHQVHHAAPFIPFYKLRSAHKFISQYPEVVIELVESHGFVDTIRQITGKSEHYEDETRILEDEPEPTANRATQPVSN